MKKKQYFCSRFSKIQTIIMPSVRKIDEVSAKRIKMAMYRRWAYMAVAVVACLLLYTRPVFTFREDIGIRYIRSFEMTEKRFAVTQTEMATGIQQITATMPVKGLYFCHTAMMIGVVLCLLCFDMRGWRMIVCAVTAGICGLYYVLMVIYAIRMADLHYATVVPTFAAILPAIVLEMMLLTRQTIIRTMFIENDAEEEKEEEKAE